MRPLKESQRELLANAANAYHDQARTAQWAADYIKSRGFDWRDAEKFLLGAVDEPFIPAHEKYRGMICIPNFCAGGELESHVVGLKFRNLGEGQKYLGLAGAQARLFNLRALQEADDLVVCAEGEIETITIEHIGLPCIGVPGTDMWGKNSYRNRLLEGFSRVILVRDNDEPGKHLAKAMADLEQLEVRVPPDPFKDTNEMWAKTKDAEAIRRFILEDK